MLADVLCGIFPELTIEKALNFLRLQLAAAIGLFQLTDLSEVQQTILEQPEFLVLKVDFAASFQEDAGTPLKRNPEIIETEKMTK